MSLKKKFQSRSIKFTAGSNSINHLRCQLIADRNEWPYTIIRFLFLSNSISVINLLFVLPGVVLKYTQHWNNKYCNFGTDKKSSFRGANNNGKRYVFRTGMMNGDKFDWTWQKRGDRGHGRTCRSTNRGKFGGGAEIRRPEAASGSRRPGFNYSGKPKSRKGVTGAGRKCVYSG